MANLSPDLNTATRGNQNQTSTSPIAAGNFLKIDVYVQNASNLDTYDFNVIYDPGELAFVEGSENQPITSEDNILVTNGGSTIGWWASVNSPGILNIANTLVGNNGENTPDGEGLLAHIVFEALTEASGKISFQDIKLFDNDGILDLSNSSSDISLPVDLLSFTASVTSEGMRLLWETASEVNNEGFNIFRSQDSLANFKKINRILIEGYGNSNSGHKYQFLDRDILTTTYYEYFLESLDYNGKRHQFATISVKAESPSIPTKFALEQNFPNPFNNETIITYHLPKEKMIEIVVYNLLGEEVEVLQNRFQKPGIYTIRWTAKDFGSGIYLLNFHCDEYNQTRKIVLIK